MLCVTWVNNSGVSNDNTSLLRLHRSIAPQKQHGAKSMWNIDARMKHCSVSSVDLDNALVRKRLRSSHLLVPWKVGKNYWLSCMCHIKKPWLIDWLMFLAPNSLKTVADWKFAKFEHTSEQLSNSHRQTRRDSFVGNVNWVVDDWKYSFARIKTNIENWHNWT